MTIHWTQEAQKRYEDYYEDLFSLLKVDSVRDDSQASAEAPVGPGPKKALETFLAMAERDGFKTANIDNIAGRVEFGQGDEVLGILAHVDVVPVDKYWETDPFNPVIKDGKLYARGASDDKGPLMAAYYALKIIKDLELPVSKRVHFIVGTDEESDWKCMDRYFEAEVKPDFGFSPDAEFPIINGEKGQYTSHLSFTPFSGDLVSFEGGQRENMVPAEAKAYLAHLDLDQVKGAAEVFHKDHPAASLAVEEADQGQILVACEGKAAHAMDPSQGENAATYLALFLQGLSDDLAKNTFVNFTANLLHEDFYGQNLGFAHHDEVMGDLTLNPGVFAPEGSNLRVTLNMRVPQGISYEEIGQVLDKLGQDYDFSREDGQSNKPPHYVPADDPLVTTLLDVYEKYTGEIGQEKVIGGGTYGRLFERGVAFGALFPDSPDTMHQANEFARLKDLEKAMAIYAEAIYRLIK
ncbi:dipeptidase PepV [Aerococcus sanguinicola]|uniref:Dipeptidase PepV n=1 Tax=Aerococcus sanguinicola TaxID=119206 RepID=A0A5N1GMB4_9LACT|nr:dipeptidase PepV [Aerococcus sanguinicola]KAA9302107.1 dipeptidase PepV [Aerococcus sanguinicola]